MTAVDLDALDKLLSDWLYENPMPYDRTALYAQAVRLLSGPLAPLIAAVRERDALRDTMLGLAEQKVVVSVDHFREIIRATVTAALGGES